jgi:hypothetical protein
MEMTKLAAIIVPLALALVPLSARAAVLVEDHFTSEKLAGRQMTAARGVWKRSLPGVR